MEHLKFLEKGAKVIEKRTKVLVTNLPNKLEYLINEELQRFYNKGIQVIDVKYAISKDIGSALIIYIPNH